jgi:hypothetical protein
MAAPAPAPESMQLEKAIAFYQTAPRLTPMTPAVQEALVKWIVEGRLAAPHRGKWAEDTIKLIAGSEATMAIRGPQLLALLPTNMLQSDLLASAYMLRGFHIYNGEPSPDDVRDSMTQKRFESMARRRGNDNNYDYERANDPYVTKLKGNRIMEIATTKPYVYTDPMSGMQRIHDPTSLVDLKREVGVTPTSGTQEMWRLAAEEMQRQRELAEAHMKHGRVMEAATHTRNAIAYEQMIELGQP